MSLGNTGLAGFTPRRNGTATSVLNTVAPTALKKTTQLQLRINEDTYLLFKEICEQNKTDVSKALRVHIDESVRRGRLSDETAASNLSVQNVSTNRNGPIKKQSEATAPSYRLGLRNKEEREVWLNKFRDWGVWLDVPDVSKKFYRFDFVNGCSVIVEIGVEYYESYCGPYAGKPRERISYSIIDNEHAAFNSQGDSFTYVVQWLTKYAKDI